MGHLAGVYTTAIDIVNHQTGQTTRHTLSSNSFEAISVGDLVKHKWGTICGRGILVSLECDGDDIVDGDRATVLWAGHVIEINAKWLETA
jgi:hypothetical protein